MGETVKGKMMSTGLVGVEQTVPTSFVGSEDEAVSATFSYQVDDPYAVTAVFSTQGVDIEWTFARDLLLDGLSFPTGEGDILVAPGSDCQVSIVLRSPEGSARLACDRTAITCFVDQVFAAVPAGSESQHLQMDSWLAELSF